MSQKQRQRVEDQGSEDHLPSAMFFSASTTLGLNSIGPTENVRLLAEAAGADKPLDHNRVVLDTPRFN